MAEPAIERDPDAKPWWDAIERGELTYQRCDECDEIVFFPRSACSNCLSPNLSWLTSKGEGTIYSRTVIHRAPDPRLSDQVPYVVVLVDLDEGFRMLSRLTSPPSEETPIGSRVRVTFRRGPGGEALPWFEAVRR